MIKKIAHLGDIHLEKNIKRHDEYKTVINRLVESIKEKKPCRTLIAGDIFDNKLETSNEMYIIAHKMINNLSKNTNKLLIITGNHDINIKNVNRKNTIDATIETIDLQNVYYLNKSGFFVDENVVWVVHDHVDGLNPWFELSKLKNNIILNNWIYNLDGSDYNEKIKLNDLENFLKNYKVINTYHNPINGSTTPSNYVMESKKYRNLSDFKGDMLLMGDIHKKQYFYK